MSTSFSFRPRGIGVNWHPCAVCGKGGGDTTQSDLAAFVDDKETGEAVVALFKSQGVTAVLDYREHTPRHVQVKLGACPDHEPFLERLMVSCANGSITEAAIADAKAGTP